MKLLRSRSEQLADHIRGLITRGELHEPLPGTRAWADKLEVSPTTLKAVLKQLKREGLLRIDPRKSIHLAAPSAARPPLQAGFVRVAYYGSEYPSRSMLPWFPALAERLFEHGVHVALESCNLSRLRALSKQKPRTPELLLLASIPGEYQEFFSHLKNRCLVNGEPNPRAGLWYVNADTQGVVTHATRSLLEHGIARLSLILPAGRAFGLHRAAQVFEETCAAWPTQPIHREVVQTELRFESMTRAAQRFAARVTSPQGVLVLDPVPLSMLVNALLERGAPVGKLVEIRGLLPCPAAVQLCHPPPCYPFPLRGVVRALTQSILRYFETGTMPRTEVTVDTDLAATTDWCNEFDSAT